MSQIPHSFSGRLVAWWKNPAHARLRRLGGAVGLLVMLGVACSTAQRTVRVPWTIPGATFVGTPGCADCHDVMVQDFTTAVHANLLAEGPNAIDVGCESCHGPGSLHYDSGEPSDIINPGRSAEVCLQCHLQVRSQFQLPYHHPMGENRLSCVDCHDPHQGPGHRGRGNDLLTEVEACLECHDAQRGPHVFEHEATREGCTTCHRPHGSVNAKLLTQRNATLCLKCHFQQQRAGGQILIGGWDHTLLLSQGTCWSAGCHEAVHGSQVSSSLRY